jgi:hypothetical protein
MADVQNASLVGVLSYCCTVQLAWRMYSYPGWCIVKLAWRAYCKANLGSVQLACLVYI